MNIKQALQTALNFEQKGEKAYYDAATNSSNELVRKTFSYLAKQELNHIKEIQNFIKSSKVQLKGDKASDTKKFFEMSVKQFKRKIELSKDDLKAYEIALKLEQNAFSFYKKQKEAIDDDDGLKKFFSFLMEQENAHYVLIQNIYSFMKDPEHFMVKEEGWMFEG